MGDRDHDSRNEENEKNRQNWKYDEKFNWASTLGEKDVYIMIDIEFCYAIIVLR